MNLLALKNFDLTTWYPKKPLTYRVVHHGYSFLLCPGPELSIKYLTYAAT